MDGPHVILRSRLEQDMLERLNAAPITVAQYSLWVRQPLSINRDDPNLLDS